MDNGQNNIEVMRKGYSESIEMVRDRLLKKDSLDRIEELAKKVMPLVYLSGNMGLLIDHFVKILKDSASLQSAIVRGEFHTWDKEWNTYLTIVSHFERGLPVTDSSGSVLINKVDTTMVAVRMKHLNLFLDRFRAFSFTCRRDKYDIDEKRVEAEPEYVKLKQQIVSRIDYLTGVSDKLSYIPGPKKQLVFNPKHYAYPLIVRGKGKLEEGELVLKKPRHAND